MPVRPPDPQYRKLLERYPEGIQKLALAARKLILEEAPEAGEFVYEVYTIADHFSFNGRPSDSFVYTATNAKWLNIGFHLGALLPDPDGLLRGEGKQMRHVRIAEAKDLAAPAVRELIRAAIELAERPDGEPPKPRTVVHLAKAARK